DLCAPPGAVRPGRPRGPQRSMRRIGVLHVGGPAPGMNVAVRTLVRTAAAAGDTVLGVVGSVHGLAAGSLRELGWAEVDDWVDLAGAVLGTRRVVPDEAQVEAIATTV